MLEILLPIAYFVTAVALWIYFSMHILHTLIRPYDGEDYFLSALFGLFSAFIWPLSLLVIGVAGIVKHREEKAEAKREEMEETKRQLRSLGDKFVGDVLTYDGNSWR